MAPGTLQQHVTRFLAPQDDRLVDDRNRSAEQERAQWRHQMQCLGGQRQACAR
jgi:hypothetical protein